MCDSGGETPWQKQNEKQGRSKKRRHKETGGAFETSSFSCPTLSSVYLLLFPPYCRPTVAEKPRSAADLTLGIRDVYMRCGDRARGERDGKYKGRPSVVEGRGVPQEN